MFWHIVLLLLSPLASLIGRLTPDDRDREILALRQQVLILQRQLAKRPRLMRTERLALLLTCLKIAGEVRKLGFTSIGRSTVERILKRHGMAPRPHHGGLSWADFLGHYGQFIWACDFFTVTTATLRTYYVLFFIEISTRRIAYWNVSEHPDGDWVAQQFRNLAVVHEDLPRYLIHDRDSKFTAYVDALLRTMGAKPVLLPPRSPDLNGRAERWVRTVRNECVDHIIVLNERHQRWALTEFVRHYNARRPHRSLQLSPPNGPVAGSPQGKVARRKVLGGLISDYHREAA